MKRFGLERGIVGSQARHKANSTYYKEKTIGLETSIAELEAEVEKTKEGETGFSGELAQAKKGLKQKETEIIKLNERT